MCIFLGQKKYGIWGDFSEKFQVLCKNPDEVTRFDGTRHFIHRVRKSAHEVIMPPLSEEVETRLWWRGKACVTNSDFIHGGEASKFA
jgi:hypothetical protein